MSLDPSKVQARPMIGRLVGPPRKVASILQEPLIPVLMAQFKISTESKERIEILKTLQKIMDLEVQEAPQEPTSQETE